jgi:pyruvate,orthophosphate dikinase
MASRALEVNLADYHVDVTIEKRYALLQEIMADYYGLLKRLNIFLKELSHPYKNWNFIVKEARSFSLGYFHLLRSHPEGPEAVRIFADIFLSAVDQADTPEIKEDAAENLLLFLQHVLTDATTEIPLFLPVCQAVLQEILEHGNAGFHFFVTSYFQPNKLATLFMKVGAGEHQDHETINRFLIRFYDQSFSYWLGLEDPLSWIEKEASLSDDDHLAANLIKETSHPRIALWQDKLQTMIKQEPVTSVELTKQLITLPGYKDFVKLFRETPQKICQSMPDKISCRRLEVMFLFYIMNTPGLAMVHKDALRDINRALTWLIGHEDYRNNLTIIDKTFGVLRELDGRFPQTVLNCVLKTGEAVYRTHEVEVINYFIDQVVDLGFHSPTIKGMGDDWQVISNNAHIQNIRIWLELIGQKPKMSARLLSALIIFLSCGGVFIKDTDLFPRDITAFLGKNIAPVYNLIKQLARLLPAFFNDIGAEGKLRDISTKLDEACLRKDTLIHFLRKQSHVESSSRVVSFIEQVMLFWETSDKTGLKPFVPPLIYDDIEEHGIYSHGMGTIFSSLSKGGIRLPQDLLTTDEALIAARIDAVTDISDLDRDRAHLTLEFYRLLNQKYNFNNIELDSYLGQLNSEDLPDTDRIKQALTETEIKKKLAGLLDYLDDLKALILSDATFEVRENMYHKRHIAVDIPSVYGSYNETRFDALGLTLRIEAIVNVLFEELINGIDLSLITNVTFSQILEILELFNMALSVDGISSNKMKMQLELLTHSIEAREFSFTQYIDIFKGFSRAVKNIIDDNFHNIHGRNILQIMAKMPEDHILEKFLPKEEEMDRKKFAHRVAELFFRDKIVTSLGLQQLDVFLNRIMNTLFRQSEKLSETLLSKLFNYDPNNAITKISGEKRDTHHIIHLGNKGLNLVELKKMGFPIPPGFIITTEAFRCQELINTYEPARANFRKQVEANLAILEKITGKAFGNPENPLLISVRSGSSISQPGMLESYMNVGINEAIAGSIAKLSGNTWFAWDCYRRFIQGYGMSFGLNRNGFDSIMYKFKKKYGVSLKREFTGDQMKLLSITYKNRVLDSGIEIIEDPIDQLYLAIDKVFTSWDSPQARAYRKIMGISDDWGTAVTVQTMVFGNASSSESGSGVFFTHSPRLPGDTLRLWGDFTIGNQGEDVVSGLVRTLAISEMQREIEQRGSDISLESGFPNLYDNLKAIAHELIYDNKWDPQEMEFTFESPNYKDLFLLQTRDMSVRERNIILSFDMDDLSSMEYLGRGIGVSGGPMSGRIVFTLEEIKEWRQQEPDVKLILIRGDTVADDIREIYAADGILTARGGVTSHASVVAHSLKKTCVVGCENLMSNEKKRQCKFENTLMKSGDFISMDGREGLVYKGYLKVNEI